MTHPQTSPATPDEEVDGEQLRPDSRVDEQPDQAPAPDLDSEA